MKRPGLAINKTLAETITIKAHGNWVFFLPRMPPVPKRKVGIARRDHAQLLVLDTLLDALLALRLGLVLLPHPRVPKDDKSNKEPIQIRIVVDAAEVQH